MFFLFLWVFVADLRRKDNKNKSQALTKGHWTAGYLFPHQPWCQLIAADILPVLFKSKQFWCTAFFCFFTKRGHGLEMPSTLPSAECLNTRRNHLIITQLALMALSSFKNTANISYLLCTEDKVNTQRSGRHKVKQLLTVMRNPEILISYNVSKEKEPGCCDVSNP